MMPPAHVVFNEWVGFLKSATHDWKYAEKYFARDIEAFNQIMDQEAKRLHLKPPAKKPDGKLLASQMGKLMQILLTQSFTHQKDAVRMIDHVETQVAMALASGWHSLAMAANHNGAKANVGSLPSEHDLMEVAKGMLTALRNENRRGRDFKQLHRELRRLAKRAGVQHPPRTRDVRKLIDGLLAAGQHAVAQGSDPRMRRDIAREEHMALMEAKRAEEMAVRGIQHNLHIPQKGTNSTAF